MTKLNHPVILTIKNLNKSALRVKCLSLFCHLCGVGGFIFIYFSTPQSSSPAMQTPFLSQEKRPSGPLETLIPLIILEFRSKSALHKPTPKPQNKPLRRAPIILLRERKALFPQYTLGNAPAQTSWPYDGRFRTLIVAYSLLYCVLLH